jgi:HlyD family secretion protein
MTHHQDPDAAGQVHRHLTLTRKLARAGYAGLALFAGTVGVWAVSMPVGGAVIASAVFVSENNVRRVQHPGGGIVNALLVREGERVAPGQVLLRLDETMAGANLQIISRQLEDARARAARLEAERDTLPAPRFPDSLLARSHDPDVAKVMAAETRIQESRTAARAGTRNQLVKRILQLRSEISGLNVQLVAKAREGAHNARELDTVRSLFQRNLVQMSRLSPLERDAALIEGVRGALEAQIAQAEGKIAETELQIIQIDTDWRSEVLRDLRETEGRIAELAERRAAAEDQFRRLDIRAPIGGVVHQLAINTVGAVLNPGEPLMLIVPTEEQLSLEARIAPTDYDLVHIGQEVRVRLHAFNQRLQPELNGVVARMAPDTSRDSQNSASLYTIRVSIPARELERLAPNQVAAGMQAEVFLRTSERSAVRYLVQPLSDQIARAFKER